MSASQGATSSYHHGDLRRQLIESALAEISESGPSSISLRSIARAAGVSHSAPQHHFGDKAGLLGAIAAQGYDLLAVRTEEAWDGEDLLAVGLAYVGFALEHRAHFEVMFRPELYRLDDPGVAAARERAMGVLFAAVGEAMDEEDPKLVLDGAVGVWAFAHGLASLWLEANFLPEVGDDPDAAARAAVDAVGRLFAAGALGASPPREGR